MAARNSFILSMPLARQNPFVAFADAEDTRRLVLRGNEESVLLT